MEKWLFRTCAGTMLEFGFSVHQDRGRVVLRGRVFERPNEARITIQSPPGDEIAGESLWTPSQDTRGEQAARGVGRRHASGDAP